MNNERLIENVMWLRILGQAKKSIHIQSSLSAIKTILGFIFTFQLSCPSNRPLFPEKVLKVSSQLPIEPEKLRASFMKRILCRYISFGLGQCSFPKHGIDSSAYAFYGYIFTDADISVKFLIVPHTIIKHPKCWYHSHYGGVYHILLLHPYDDEKEHTSGLLKMQLNNARGIKNCLLLSFVGTENISISEIHVLKLRYCNGHFSLLVWTPTRQRTSLFPLLHVTCRGTGGFNANYWKDIMNSTPKSSMLLDDGIYSASNVWLIMAWSISFCWSAARWRLIPNLHIITFTHEDVITSNFFASNYVLKSYVYRAKLFITYVIDKTAGRALRHY